jgi:hypothetical protein
MALPVYSAEMNFSASMAGYFRIGTDVLGTGQIGGGYGVHDFTSVQARLMAVQTARGRQDELSGIAAGTTQVSLDDDDGALDPDNAASPYYPNVKPMRQVRVTATWAGVDYGLGYGFVGTYGAAPLALGANVTLQATDLFKRLDRYKAVVSFPQQTVGARIGALLDAIQWPAAQRQIDATTLTVPAITLDLTTSFLQHIDALVKAERGDFFIAGNGDAVYHARTRRLTSLSIGTFGAGGYPVTTVQAAYDDSGIYNEIHVKRTAGTDQVAADTASQQLYDTIPYVLDQTAADQLPSDTDASALAAWILSQRKDPIQRIKAIVLDPTANDALWPLVLGAEIGQRLTLTHDVPGTKGLIAQDYAIESVAHTWNPTASPEHTCTLGLSLAPVAGAYMVIGTGAVGTGQLAY